MITADPLTTWLVLALLAVMLVACVLTAVSNRREQHELHQENDDLRTKLSHEKSLVRLLAANLESTQDALAYFETRASGLEARALSHKAALEAHQHHCRTHHGLSPENQAKVNESLDRAFSRALIIVDEARHG